MRSWENISGILTIAGATERLIPSTEDVFRYFIEDDKSWAGELINDQKISGLRFSKYPLKLSIALEGRKNGQCLAVVASRRDAHQRIEQLELLDAGHLIVGDRWYPLEAQSLAEVRDFLRQHSIQPGDPASLKIYLALRKAGEELYAGENALPAMTFVPEDRSAPRGIEASLYPYQLDGWRWCRFVLSEGVGGLLADEMGLGKTLQVIAAIADPVVMPEAPVLVIAPGSLLENWVREFKKFAPQLRTLKHHGSDRTGRPADLGQFDVVVTSYDTVIRDNSLFLMITWAAVICDEAQYIRNPDSLRARSVKRLRRIAAMAVTGTPVENRLIDLWSIVDFILPGYLGSLEQFHKDYSDDHDGAVKLEHIVSPVMLRRRIADVAQDLPERIDIPQVIELGDEQSQAYDDIRTHILNEYGASATLVALTKLRMFCAHPWIVEGTPRSGKLADFEKYARLIDILEEIFAAREKVILFCAYTAMADLIAADIAQRFSAFTGVIDGRLPIDDRQPLIDEFSAVKEPALLVLNPRAGGSGLNITAANHVIHYTLEWNPALEDQASARAHRRGQTRPVTVHRLFCAGTVEEVVDNRLSRKRIVAGAAVVGIRGEADDYEDIVAALQKTPMARGGK